MSLYKRLTITGTLSEPKGTPDPLFALPSTVNWMRALAFLVAYKGISSTSARSFYSSVSERHGPEQEQNTVLEQLLFALHQCSALRVLRTAACKADVARVGIVTWYYGIYAAASAMTVAQDGSFKDDHTGTANVWDRQIATPHLIMSPFDARVGTLLRKDADKELASLLTVPRFVLTGNRPKTAEDAMGACHAYLSGNVEWWRERSEENIRASRDFKELGVENFRTAAARELRDKRLSGRGIGFLHQAFRYRGKANYREALYLGYGTSVESILAPYVDDLSVVLDAFVTAAGLFCARRLGAAVWDEFVSDIEAHRAFSTSPSTLWG
jgi:hypothetical protein